MNESTQQNLAVAVKRLQTIKLNRAFDPAKPESRPTEVQEEVLRSINVVRHRYVQGGNQSGKTQLGARELSWVLLDKHPYWERPAEWGDEPLLVLVLGRTTTQVEENIWERKLKPFFPAGSYREIRTAGALQKIKFTNGNTIIFMSHHAPDEAAAKAQAFVAHYVWLDELCDSVKLLEELHRRVNTLGGYFLATYTPKFRNDDVRKLIDTPSSIHKKFALSVLDNPLYAEGSEQRTTLLETIKTYSDEYKQMLLTGSWFLGDQAVYQFDLARHVQDLPIHYSYLWRHVISFDPAASGKSGLVVFAENPRNGVWYVVKCWYLDGKAGSDLAAEVQKLTRFYNVTKRISDPHEVWFIKEARKLGINFSGIYDKKNRKSELINALQERLLCGTLKVTPECEEFISEITGCQWHETIANKIIAASKYHLLDAAQYAVDSLPKYDDTVTVVATSPQHATNIELKKANEKRKKKEAAIKARCRVKRGRRSAWR